MRRGLIFSVAITLILFGVYYQVSDHGFLDFDDMSYVVENPAVNQGLTAKGAADAFRVSQAHYWHPVSTLSHALDVEIFGMRPGYHHLVNVLFHIYVVLLCFWIFFLATGKFGASAFAAALLALHPMNVESVVWLAERKTALSAFFGLAAMLLYTFYVKRSKAWLYALIAASFAVALLAKPAIAPLALVLLLMDYWPFYRAGERGADGSPGFSWPVFSRLLVEKVPLLVIAAIVILVVRNSMDQFQNIIPGAEDAGLRVSNALVSYPRYLLKLLWPDNLAAYYPWPKSVPLWQAAAALVFLIAVTAFVIRYAKRMPYLIVGWLWFLGGMIPVIGLVQGGLWPAWADRFVYFPAIGLFVAVSFFVDELADRRGMDRSVLMPSGVLVALCLAAVTWVQVGFWKNDFTLFSRAAAVTAQNSVAFTSLGGAYAVRGDFDKALYYFESAVKANPYDSYAYRNMADIFFKRGEFKKAEELYRKSLAINPSDHRTYKKYARLLTETKRPDEAVEMLKKALTINPGDYEAESNLGLVYLAKEDTVTAIAHFERSLGLNPGYSKAKANLDNARTVEKIGKAVAEVKKALAKKGDDPKLLNYLGALYVNMGKAQLALEPLSKASVLDPGNAEIWSNFGLALLRTSAFPKAKEALDTALSLDPKNVAVHYNMACLHSVMGNADKAAEWIGKAVELGFSDWKLMAVDPDLANARRNKAVQRLILDHSGQKAELEPSPVAGSTP
ncbi:MAG: tetratricopeptide repeat protein [Deltaproteobacteria bacterium]|nr:tetratricopeptide repeat protein [Deltaproteobacteria bacterium]